MNVNHPFVPTYSTQPTVCSRFTTSSNLVLNSQVTTEPNSQNVFKIRLNGCARFKIGTYC